ncbi:MAG: 3-phosphoshikimate 1-carboxyvinyltransferase [Nitrospirae bacterium]|nr:3-phosphoshikimate 1-carboxyvinyltransferase [Nitrospirota bacterium]
MTRSLRIAPARCLRGELTVPGDKSISHRAAILGAIAQGETTLRGFLRGEDCLRTLEAVRSLGVGVRETPSGEIRVPGKGIEQLSEPENILDLGNSGTGFRLLAGLVAGRPFLSILTGDASLRRRPMGRIVEPLRQMGARIEGRQGGQHAPLAIRGGDLRGIMYRSPVASAQVKSALLLAGLSADGETWVEEPALSRDHTERMLEGFGVKLRRDGLRVGLLGGQTLTGREVEIPGDFSSSAFFLVGALVLPGSDLVIRQVGVNPTRTGLLDVLLAMGARIAQQNLRGSAGESVADLTVTAGPLHGTTVEGDLIPRLIDEFPVLCVAALFAEGETVIRGAEELRVKEADRIAAMAAGIRALGGEVEELPDGIRIQGRAGPLRGGKLESFGDHRVAMALAIAALAAAGETDVEGAEWIATSFPGFEETLQRVAVR